MNELDQHPWVRQEYVAAYRERLSSGLVQHLLAVPLNGKSGTFGVLRLLNKLRTPTTLEPSGFDNWDETYLTTVGASVASAIEYAQLLHANKTRLAEISRFYRIYAASAQGNQKNAFQVIVDEALQALPDAHKCEIRLVDDESRTFVSYAVSRRAGIPDHGEPPLHVMEGIAGRALREHTIQVVHDVGQDADFVARGVTIRSLIVAPLFGEMGPVGTLSIDSDRSNVFTHEHEKLISALATHASLALDMTWRYERAQALRQMITAMTESLDEQAVFQRMFDALKRLVGYDNISIQLLDGDLLCLRIAACDGFPDNEAVRWLTFPINDPNFPNFEVIQHRRRLVIDDAHVSYPHFVEDVERYQTHNIRSFCCLPLVHRGEVIGMVAIGKSTPGYYTAERADLAEVIAGAGASAVSNARFVKEVAEKAKAFLTLMQTSAALIRGHRPEALYRFYAQAGVEVFNVEVCSIYLWNEQDKQYTLAAAAGQEPSDHTLDVQARAVFAGAVANSGHSLNLSGKSLQQAYADNGYDADEQAHLLSGRAQSLLIGPIFDSNSTHIGAVVLENQRGENKESGFGPFYLELLEGFAIQLVLPLATIDASRRARDSLNDDLHDMMNFVHGTLVQTTAYLQTKLAPTLIGEDLAELKRIHRAAKYVYHGIRRINDDVRDPIIQERGLVEALRQYSNLFFDRVKVDIIEKGTLRLPSDIGYALYRIGQETLHNISKHAQLSPIDGRVLIVLSESDGQYQLCIEDNGIGFPADRGTPPPESYGLLSIGRWCELIGARLQIYQRPGNGVGVSIEGELRKETIWVSASGF